MRVIVIGATGTIGRSVVEALTPRHQVVPVSYRQCQIRVDLGDPSSIADRCRTTGQVDAVISTAAAGRSAPLAELTDEDFVLSLHNKLMGQVNLVRLGFAWLHVYAFRFVLLVSSFCLAQQSLYPFHEYSAEIATDSGAKWHSIRANRQSEKSETCMMDVGPHRECSGTMVETKAVVGRRRSSNERPDVCTAGLRCVCRVGCGQKEYRGDV